MAWLVRDTTVLASLEVADTFRSRLRGLLGRDRLDGALLLRPARSVHSVGMRFALDVAFCDRDLRVVHITSLVPNRLARPVRGACMVLEAEWGTFERWGLEVGDELAVHGEALPPPAAWPGGRRWQEARHRLIRGPRGPRGPHGNSGARVSTVSRPVIRPVGHSTVSV